MEEQKNSSPAPEFVPQGILEGHSNWVTSIVAGYSQRENEDSPVLISASRDKSLIIWKLFEEQSDDGFYGQPYRQLTGHNHFVTDLALSNENQFVISSSWDKTLRLWDLRQGKTSRMFTGHTREVLSVAFSPDNRQIISTGADREIKLWNTLADCKFTSEKFNHTDWVSCVRYSPVHKSSTKHQPFDPYFATVGWDGRLKIWSTNIQVRYTFKAHEGMISSVSISPNGKYLATGGKDKKVYVWDIVDLNNRSREFEAGAQINQIAFNPKLQWVAVGTEKDIKVWDLMNVSNKPISVLEVDQSKKEKEGKGKRKPPMCTSLTWNALGKKLFAGYSDGAIRVWHVNNSE
jgi:guanine nucleotide-binding protein subunit beta-2-like 1 protein